MAVRNPERGGAAATDLHLTPTATARDPGWERGLVKQIMEEEEEEEVRTQLKSLHTLTCTCRVHLTALSVLILYILMEARHADNVDISVIYSHAESMQMKG